jgi:hypothetical protein
VADRRFDPSLAHKVCQFSKIFVPRRTVPQEALKRLIEPLCDQHGVEHCDLQAKGAFGFL